MLCAYLRKGQWHSLATYHDPAGEGLLLRCGACPGDPGGEVIALLGPVDADEIPDRAAAWVRHGWADGSAEPPAAPTAIPRVAASRPPVDRPPGDQPLTPSAARRAVVATVGGASSPYCVFPNPAARRP
ncbi:MAG: hypothetical protein ACRDPC_18705 [Solirubrobacteraceae bacterium]